nr:pyridoxamine 5'-phosphate oxidase family protein [Rhizobium ruizarguesonis]
MGQFGGGCQIGGGDGLVRDKAAFEEHWVPDLERWFPEGVDTPGIVLIKVSASSIRYWDGEKNGEVALPGSAS